MSNLACVLTLLPLGIVLGFFATLTLAELGILWKEEFKCPACKGTGKATVIRRADGKGTE